MFFKSETVKIEADFSYGLQFGFACYLNAVLISLMPHCSFHWIIQNQVSWIT